MPRVSGELARGETEPVWTAAVEDYATALSVSPDGRRAAVGSASGTVSVFDVATGALLWSASAHGGGVLALHAGDRGLVSGGQDGTAKLYAMEGGLVRVLPGGAPWVEHAEFSPNGKIVATAAGRKLRLWTAAGDPIVESEEHESTISALAWGKSGAELATGCYGGVHIHDARTKKRSRHLAWKGSLISLAWSPNERVIAAGSQDCSVHFWRLSSGKDSEMSGYPFKPKALAWDATNTYLATGGFKDITVWKFAGRGPEGSQPLVLSAHQALVTTMAFHPQRALLASGSQDSGVVIWEVGKGWKPTSWGFMDDHVSGIAWSVHAQVVVATSAAGQVAAFRAP